MSNPFEKSVNGKPDAKRINIPFMKEMAKAIVEGNKSCTSRRIQYGKIGDVFTVVHEGKMAICTITAVNKLPLSTISEQYYKSEGVDSPFIFRELWAKIHPRRGYVATDQVWLHEFSVKLGASR